jgi:hypothetical protein
MKKNRHHGPKDLVPDFAETLFFFGTEEEALSLINKYIDHEYIEATSFKIKIEEEFQIDGFKIV